MSGHPYLAQPVLQWLRERVDNSLAGVKYGEAVAEIERLTKQLRIAELKASGTLANNLCPDHRDKQVGKPCLACEIERLTAQIGKLEDDLHEERINSAAFFGDEP